MGAHLRTNLSIAASRLPAAPGIYGIRNRMTGEFYIGSSVNVRVRVMSLVSKMQRRRGWPCPLGRSCIKHGSDAFVVAVIEECPPHHLQEREQHYLDTYNSALNRSGWAKRSRKAKCELLEEVEPVTSRA